MTGNDLVEQDSIKGELVIYDFSRFFHINEKSIHCIKFKFLKDKQQELLQEHNLTIFEILSFILKLADRRIIPPRFLPSSEYIFIPDKLPDEYLLKFSFGESLISLLIQKQSEDKVKEFFTLNEHYEPRYINLIKFFQELSRSKGSDFGDYINNWCEKLVSEFFIKKRR